MYIAKYIITYGGGLVKTWKWRRPIIKFKTSPSRYNRKEIKKQPKPIKRGKYAQYLWDIGAGWSDE